jgi:hypothetical protein
LRLTWTKPVGGFVEGQEARSWDNHLFWDSYKHAGERDKVSSKEVT